MYERSKSMAERDTEDERIEQVKQFDCLDNLFTNNGEHERGIKRRLTNEFERVNFGLSNSLIAVESKNFETRKTSRAADIDLVGSHINFYELRRGGGKLRPRDRAPRGVVQWKLGITANGFLFTSNSFANPLHCLDIHRNCLPDERYCRRPAASSRAFLTPPIYRRRK
ncbi:hypothetical protein EVAR_36656_1 [Eumeta japonica]|uniref:Uncharacterized protein n=1 Tax=Eumeta variegata TaxID=151549 RepID=A0A4C1XWK1_EUMVA|nr:hypothetical protein EVAR_36656_1 [Eumeta japonica]